MDNNNLISALYHGGVDIPTIITGKKPETLEQRYQSLTRTGPEGEQLVHRFNELSETIKKAQEQIGMNHETYMKWKEMGRNFRYELQSASDLIKDTPELSERVNALKNLNESFTAFYNNAINKYRSTLRSSMGDKASAREIRDRNLIDLITTNLPYWQGKAELSPTGLYLISKHTEEGSALREEARSTLLNEYGVRAIIVTDTGKVFLRRENDRVLGRGGYKDVFEVGELSGKKYAWFVLRDHSNIASYNSPAIQALKKFIKETPNASFNEVGEFVRHGAKGLSVGELFDGSAESLRKERGQPVFKGQHIIDIVSSLEQLHRAGIAHRDIKPANFLMKDGKPYFHDYDLVTLLMGEKNEGTVGTPDFMPWEFIAFALYKPILPSMLPKADVFAMARTLFLDRNPEMETVIRGYDPYDKFVELYLRDMGNALLDHRDTPGDLRNLLRNAVNDPKKIKFIFSKRTPEEQRFMIQAFLDAKQRTHEAEAPNDAQPFLEYRKLLWTAMAPDPAKRPDAAQFLTRLQALQNANQIPT